MTDLIRELEGQLAAADEGPPRIDALNALSWALRLSDVPRAITLCEQAISLMTDGSVLARSYPRGLALSWHQLARLRMWAADYDRALAAYLQALSIYETLGDQDQIAAQLSYIGVTYLYVGNYPDGLQSMLKAQALFEASGNPERIAEGLNDIGYLHLVMHEPAKGLPYLLRSEELFQTVDNLEKRSWLYDSLCHAYYDLGDYARALDYIQRGIELCRQTGEKLDEAQSILMLGKVHLASGQPAEALACFDASGQLAETQGYQRCVAEAQRTIGDFYRGQGDTARALTHLQRALEIAQSLDAPPTLFECHRSLAEAYKASGAYEAALSHFEQFHALKEQVFNAQADLRVRTLEIAYQAEAAHREAEMYQLKTVALQRELDERRQAEAALHVANARLEQEIAARQQLIDDLNAFAHTVAHDLKGPLGVIVGYSDLLQASGDSLDAAIVAESLRTITRTGYKASRIIDDLLLLASVRQQDVDVKVLDMAAIQQEVEVRIAPLIARYQAKIIWPADWPCVLGYPLWIEEVWVNYLSNAIKYGGTPPCIEVGAARGEGLVRFWVHDNGDGLSAEQQAQLFGTFKRLVTKAEGHGLGLSIVKRIVEKLGGQVAVESAGLPGLGSLFSFTLPAAPPG